MSRSYLNVMCGNKRTMINMTRVGEICDVRYEIKEEFGLTIGRVDILLYLTNPYVLITKLEDIPNDYFVKDSKSYVEAHLTPPIPPLWSVDALDENEVIADAKNILSSLKLPALQTIIMKNENVPLNPMKPDRVLMLLTRLNHIDLNKLEIRFQDHQTWSLLATSGMGKTHHAFAFLNRYFGLYFTCAKPNHFNHGSADMPLFLERLAVEGRIGDNAKQNNEYVDRYMRCMILARLFILNYFQKELGEQFTPFQWLILQLFPPIVGSGGERSDLFSYMTKQFRKLSLAALSKELEVFRQEDQPRLPVFIDEAQITCNLYKNSFTFSESRPLYSALCHALINLDLNISVCTLGTGLSLYILGDLNVSDTIKTGGSSSVNLVIDFRYLKAADIFEYINNFVDLPPHLTHMCEWLVGRPRIAALFIQKIHENKGIDNDVCKRYIELMTTLSDDLSFYNKIERIAAGLSSIQKGPELTVLLNDLKLAVELFVYKGDSYVCNNGDLFEQGFGLLMKSESKDVIVCEPLLIAAAFNFIFRDDSVKLRDVPTYLMAYFENPAVHGFIFELTVPRILEQLLAMRKPERKAAFGHQLWRHDSLQICRDKTAPFVPYCRKESVRYPLQSHLISPRCLVLSLNTDRGADFASSFGNNSGKIGEISVQAKFAKNFNQKSALEKSTWKEFEYNEKKIQIRLLLAYPKKTKFKLCTVERNMITLIIDQRNAHFFYSKKELAHFD